ncbi:MAG: hypothetical protein V2J89_13215, partial [Halieaceae bacterium]|nr:hypothetical protein [Halieaceae bacterium]
TTAGGGSAAASYLLFAQSFIDEIIALGYRDAMWDAGAMRAFFTSQGEPELEKKPKPRRGLRKPKPSSSTRVD